MTCLGCNNIGVNPVKLVDGRTPLPEGTTRAQVVTDWLIGHMRSLVSLKQKGLV